MANRSIPSFEDYVQHGWVLVPIERDRKAPRGLMWNERENCYPPQKWNWPEGTGMGLAHAYSGTCSIDADQFVPACQALEWGYGVDLDFYFKIPQRVEIYSGRAGHGKLLFAMPPGLVLPSAAIRIKGRHALEFRCATRGGFTVQDVLPPTIHPDTGKPYEWRGREDWWNPEIIPDELLTVWSGLLRPPQEKKTDRPPIQASHREIEQALTELDPDMGMAEWIEVGFALHSTGDDGLMELWDEWSQGSQQGKYLGRADIEARWRSFNNPSRVAGSAVTLSSLFFKAREAQRKRGYAEERFGPVNAGTASVPPSDGLIIDSNTGRPLNFLEEETSVEKLVEKIKAETTNPDLSAGARIDAAKAVIREAAQRLSADRYDAFIVEVKGRDIAPAIGMTAKRIGEIARETWQEVNPHGVVARTVPKDLQEVFQEFFYVAEPHVFVRPSIRSILKREAFRDKHCHMSDEILELALTENYIRKVDALDYWPEQDPVIRDNGKTYANLWTGIINRGREGDCSLWLNHFKTMHFKAEEIKHLLQWMAYTLRYPGTKINHGLIISGFEGSGKDTLFFPLDKALAENAVVMDAAALFSDFNAEIMGRKLLRINETAIGDHQRARDVEEKLKPMLATPPEKIWVNEKNIAKFQVRNVFNVAITTNSLHPLNISQESRRYYALRSDLKVQDENGDQLQEWADHFNRLYQWMEGENGWECCVWYLLNKVDLSDFDPKKAPHSTEFRREIQERSKSRLQAAIEAMIEARREVFSLPLVRAEDIHQMFAPGSHQSRSPLMNLHGIKSVPSLQQISLALSQIGLQQDKPNGVNPETGRRTKYKFWILNEPEKYWELSGPERVVLYHNLIAGYEKENSPFCIQ